ncbi:MAG: hypothetical protein HY269_03345, partial [Deltaproteobacteria bacterium]|nr:hypothetical protein [Deltaproteobacteria bacterium]
NLWAGTVGGVFRLAGGNPQGKFERVPLNIPGHAEQTIEVQQVIGDDEGSVWVGTDFGLARVLPDGRCKHYIAHPSENMDLVWTLLRDHAGRLWLGLYGNGLLVFKPEPAAQADTRELSFQRTALRDNLVNGKVILPDKPGEARLYTTARSNVVTAFDGQRFRNFTHTLTRRTAALAEDNAGNVWVGARSGGVTRLSRYGFLTYRAADGLGMNDVHALNADREGTLTIVSNGWFLNQPNAQTGSAPFVSVKLNLPKEIAESSVGNRDMIQDHTGDWWITSGMGLVRFSGSAQFTDLAQAPPLVYTKRAGLADDNVNRVFEDSRGDIWVSSYFPPVTLARWERTTNKWYRYGERDGMPVYNWVNRFAEDKAGNVWCGMHNGGLMRWRQGRFEYFGQEAGLPFEVAYGLHVERNGRLWLGTKGRGAVRCDDPTAEHPRFMTYTFAQGLASEIVWSFTEDKWGRVYIGHARGVDRLDISTGRIKHFTEADGLSRGEVMEAFTRRSAAALAGDDQPAADRRATARAG